MCQFGSDNQDKSGQSDDIHGLGRPDDQNRPNDKDGSGESTIKTG